MIISNYQNGKTGECGNGSTKKQYEKLLSIFRNRWHSLNTSEVTGFLSLSYTHTHTHTHKMQLITKKKYYSRRLNTSERMTLDLLACIRYVCKFSIRENLQQQSSIFPFGLIRLNFTPINTSTFFFFYIHTHRHNFKDI